MQVYQVMLFFIILLLITVAGRYIFYYVKKQWQWRKVKKAGANLGKFMEDYFSNLPPRESEFCKDCIHAEWTNNHSKLLCLHGKSRHFGTAVYPENDMMGFCDFKRRRQIETDE